MRAVAAFEAAARHKSFARAAEELGVTRAAISHAVGGLERRLGAPLFERIARRLKLTETGLQYAAQVRVSLSMLTQAFDASVARLGQRLVIAAEPGVGDVVFTANLSALIVGGSALRLEIRTMSDPGAVFRAEADVWVGFGGSDWKGLSAAHLADEALVAVAAPGSPWTSNQMEDLATVPRIELARFPWWAWFDSAGGVGPAVNPPALTVDTVSQALAAARGGLGVSLIPRRLAEADLASGQLKSIGAGVNLKAGSYYAVWNPLSRGQELIRQLIAHLTAELAGGEALPDAA